MAKENHPQHDKTIQGFTQNPLLLVGTLWHFIISAQLKPIQFPPTDENKPRVAGGSRK